MTVTAQQIATPLRERVAQACRVLGRLDLAKGTSGHVSVRVPHGDRFLIRGRGSAEVGVRYTSVDEIVECNADGAPAAGSTETLGVPFEVYIHSALYQARPDINAVVHVHPATVVLFTIVDRPLLPIFGSYDPTALTLALQGIPAYDRSALISTPDLGAELAKTMGTHASCTMRGHGITTVGPTIEEAAIYAILLNELAEMNYRAALLGTPRSISDEDKKALADLDLMRPSKLDADGMPTGRTGALWRYYVALTES